MPYDLFWHGPFSAYTIYMEKARQDTEHQRNEMLDRAWLYGNYFGMAMLENYKAFNPYTDKRSPDYPYPKEPFRPKPEPTSEEKAERKALLEKMKKVNEELGK